MTIYLHSFHHSFASNGIKITYELIRILNELGYTAKNLCFDPYIEGSNFPEVYLKNTIFCTNNFFPKINDDDIMIYPEHVQGNPLGAKRIVRYLLNKPYYLFGYGIDYTDSDYVMAFSQLVSKKIPILYLLIDEREMLERIRKNAKHNENTISIYLGKVDLDFLKTKKKFIKKISKKYANVNVITRQFPAREIALETIANSSLLLSFDPLSNLNYEATLTGTPVLLLDDFYDTKNIELPAPQKGLFYDDEDFEKAKNEVALSYMYYREYIEEQKNTVRHVFEKIKKHFENIKDVNYLSENRRKNLGLKAEDFENFKTRKNKIYDHINFYTDIPTSVAFLLGNKVTSEVVKFHAKKILKGVHLLGVAKKMVFITRVIKQMYRGGGK